MQEEAFYKLLVDDREKAYLFLVDSYSTRVYNTCYNLVRSREDAEDLTQEVFTTIYVNIDRFKKQSKLSTWIYSIAVNKSKEFLRHKTRKKRFGIFTVLEKEETHFMPSKIIEFEHPGVKLENKERAKILFQAIENLPLNQKTAYILHKVEGVSYAEIAEIMKSSISSVESLLFRAKKGLQNQLQTYYDENEL